MGSWYGDVGDFLSDAGRVVAQVAIAPIVIPLQVSAEVARKAIEQAQRLRAQLTPPQPPQAAAGGGADIASILGLGGGAAGGAGGAAPSNLPLILGGLAAAGLLVTVLVVRSRRK